MPLCPAPECPKMRSSLDTFRFRLRSWSRFAGTGWIVSLFAVTRRCCCRQPCSVLEIRIGDAGLELGYADGSVFPT